MPPAAEPGWARKASSRPPPATTGAAKAPAAIGAAELSTVGGLAVVKTLTELSFIRTATALPSGASDGSRAPVVTWAGVAPLTETYTPSPLKKAIVWPSFDTREAGDRAAQRRSARWACRAGWPTW